MDLLKEFMTLKSSFNRELIPGSATGGRLKVGPNDFPEDPLKTKVVVERESDYVKEAREEERVWQENVYENDEMSSRRGAFSEIDDTVSTYGLSDPAAREENTRVYKIYDFSQRKAVGLPIETLKDKILDVVYANPVCVVQGATGCGKTTQVPQYILDFCRGQGLPCNIIVTQPRRLAAITVAKRVAYERGWKIPGIVGYQVGLNMQTSPDTRLTFCTTGVLLQKLINERSLLKYTHIILDEVHERNEDMDFLMMVVRKFLHMQSTDTRVILMSATLDPGKYCHYFGSMGYPEAVYPAPLIDIDYGRRKKHMFTVSTYYLNQLHILGELPEIQYDEPRVTQGMCVVAYKLIAGFDKLEELSKASDRGAVLIFLPGIQEIEELYTVLTTMGATRKLWVRPLHSTITTDEQELVFCKPPTGSRKVILSTNIAESSLTVPDIVYVIDFCLTKQLVCDPGTNFSSLQITWASKTNCIQRAGRAGRVRDGRVYRLVPETFYEEFMPPTLPPEILRCPLSRTVLLAKLLKMGPPKRLLGLCLDPPDLTNIRSTILSLKEAGALLKTIDGQHDPEDGDITYLGFVMAKLPLDIHVSKLIMLGHLFNILEDCIIIGSALSLKNMFSSPFREQMAAYQSRLTWADGSCSDCFAFLNAFKVWKSHKVNGMFNQAQREDTWARRYFLQLSTLKEINTLVNEIQKRLEKLSIKPSSGVDVVQWTETEKFMVLRFVIAGAFYPNYFVRSGRAGQIDEKDAVRQVVGRDPFNTVFLQGMPLNQPGQLYVRAIKNALSECGGDMRVSCDSTTKIYVQFSRPRHSRNFDLVGDIPGKICMPVYKAVKMRQLKLPVRLNLMDAEKAMIKARRMGLKPAQEDTSWRWDKKEGKGGCLVPSLPSIDTSYIYICITHFIDPGCFWAHPTVAAGRDRVVDERDIIVQMLSKDPVKKLRPISTPRPVKGKLYAYPQTYREVMRYYRCQVLAVSPSAEKTRVFFIDSGRTLEVETRKLRDFGEELIEEGILKFPPQVFECSLSEVRPSQLLDARGNWCEDAKKAFLTIQAKGNVFGKIYSVVHGVVYLELYGERNLPFPDAQPFESVNHYFIRKQWAEHKEESYQSKYNHELRENASNLSVEVNAMHVIEELQCEYAKDWLQTTPDPELPTEDECIKWITLRGPYSPLEMKLYALPHIGITRSITIDWASVNSVLLDSDPQDPHERMMVACHVGENAEQNKLNLRNTSMLPNIHGLSAIICMVFAPTVEMRVNTQRTRFTGALCGLGIHPNSLKPLFPDHDMEVAFDTKITLDDLQDVNKLRFWMTQGFLSDEDYNPSSAGPVTINYCQGKVRECFLKLLRVQRPPQEVEMFPRPHLWNQLDTDFVMEPGDFTEQERAVYPLHYGVELEEEPEPDIIAHLEHLREIAEGKAPLVDNLVCAPCQEQLSNLRLLQVHLVTQKHREKEQSLRAASMPSVVHS